MKIHINTLALMGIVSFVGWGAAVNTGNIWGLIVFSASIMTTYILIQFNIK